MISGSDFNVYHQSRIYLWIPMRRADGGGGGGGDPGSTSGLSAVLGRFNTQIAVLGQSATDLILEMSKLSAGAEWVDDGGFLTLTTSDTPSISRMPDNSYTLCCHSGSGVRVSRWSRSRGEYSVQVIGSGTVPTHILDRNGRLIVASWVSTAWVVRVGILQSDGATYSFSSPVAMVDASSVSIGGSEKQSSLIELPDGSLLFVYPDGDASTMRRCRSLSNAGIGAWG